MNITILGLGPGDPELLTRRAWRILSEAEEVYLRTARHPNVSDLPIRKLHSFDAWYDAAEDFASLYQRIAEEIVRLGRRPQGVVYAVPGHPLVGEQTVTLILQQARAQSVPVQIVDGLSFIEPLIGALGIDALDGLQIHDAETIAHMHHPPLNPDVPALLAQVYSSAVASDVKLTLANQYPETHEVILVHGAGTLSQRLERLPLYALDRQPVDHLTSLYVPPLQLPGSFEHFQEIMAHLRAPDGCPWDRQQTHESLRPYLLEETYEVLEALDNGDIELLKRELGDLLLQVVFHAQIAVESGEFSMADVIAHVCQKLIRRHPHVWGDVQVSDSAQVHANWDQIKRQERAAEGITERGPSALDGVPKTLPALAAAAAIHARASRVGFEWSRLEDVIAKVREELDELLRADDAEQRREEFGDVLSSLVNLARWYQIDPEAALRENIAKFVRRFQRLEQQAAAQGKALQSMTLDELDALWNAVKSEGL
ncbi:MAG: nucleoside triphosphate pyrophosphohydrolase [Candidatus Thermofonsia Clade 1 bacterium]|jgi:tetrapyrrole methylase family protein/MazG family protein|uniref:Nucleoside triphosphate pyrophosphohydrolase n=1 Tax=Candidatus Thermofonsia Clade 1 bacterium TaxID=2364210 RepID=A0A2M8PCF9_9CHLR|nr:MAG: nucleoside triphosphate pyrophosphohydrolase [Candidatus Thermofonsia Clade 1 bacterium]RMF52035.1 MAG: nucleoside triphosphate pyrophosphohydrolase [Chloroflexota bacterium]